MASFTAIDDRHIGMAIKRTTRTSSLPPSRQHLEPRNLLCVVCYYLLIDPDLQAKMREDPENLHASTRWGRILHHPSFDSLWYSAMRPCRICSVVLDQILQYQTLNINELAARYADVGFETVWEFSGRDGDVLEVHRATAPTIMGFVPLATFRRIPRPGIIRYTPLSPELDNSIKQLLNKWRFTCKSQHSCRRPDSTYMPTRLLDVQGDDDSIRLVTFEKSELARNYATLSHVWGGAKHTVLTTSNLESFKVSVPPDALPRCFQQAIFVARLLEIQYLWIDSLCIIQDSNDDWEAEAAAMSSVYGNSILNIAMSSASQNTEGCFSQRDVRELRVPTINHIGYSPRERQNEIYEPQFVGFVETWQWWKDHPSSGALETRAWVLQERLLSPRILHLTHKQAFWECQESGCCEMFPDGVPADLMTPELRVDRNAFSRGKPNNDELESYLSHRQFLAGYTTKRRKLPYATRYHTGEESYEPEDELEPSPELGSHWKYIVEEFCKRKLSFGKDKLVALSGIASTLEARADDKYILGLWESSLPHSLLWHASPLPDAAGPYRAPSWSWASVDGLVTLYAVNSMNLYSEPTQPIVDIDGVSWESPARRDDAEPSRAILNVRGCLCTLLSPEEPRRGMTLWSLPRDTESLHPRAFKFMLRAKDGHSFIMSDAIEIDPVRLINADPTDADALFEERVFILPILVGLLGLRSLILLERENGRYERIGITSKVYGSEWVEGRLLRSLAARRESGDQDVISII